MLMDTQEVQLFREVPPKIFSADWIKYQVSVTSISNVCSVAVMVVLVSTLSASQNSIFERNVEAQVSIRNLQDLNSQAFFAAQVLSSLNITINNSAALLGELKVLGIQNFSDINRFYDVDTFNVLVADPTGKVGSRVLPSDLQITNDDFTVQSMIAVSNCFDCAINVTAVLVVNGTEDHFTTYSLSESPMQTSWQIVGPIARFVSCGATTTINTRVYSFNSGGHTTVNQKLRITHQRHCFVLD